MQVIAGGGDGFPAGEDFGVDAGGVGRGGRGLLAAASDRSRPAANRRAVRPPRTVRREAGQTETARGQRGECLPLGNSFELTTDDRTGIVGWPLGQGPGRRDGYGGMAILLWRWNTG